MAGTGGHRLGAGRKPNKVNLLRKSVALGMLSEQEERNQWRRFLKSDDEDIAFKAFQEWNNRSFGKSKETIEMDARLSVAQVDVNL